MLQYFYQKLSISKAMNKLAVEEWKNEKCSSLFESLNWIFILVIKSSILSAVT